MRWVVFKWHVNITTEGSCQTQDQIKHNKIINKCIFIFNLDLNLTLLYLLFGASTLSLLIIKVVEIGFLQWSLLIWATYLHTPQLWESSSRLWSSAPAGAQRPWWRSWVALGTAAAAVRTRGTRIPAFDLLGQPKDTRNPGAFRADPHGAEQRCLTGTGGTAGICIGRPAGLKRSLLLWDLGTAGRTRAVITGCRRGSCSTSRLMRRRHPSSVPHRAPATRQYKSF